MNLSERKVWQQACGDPPRSYADLCLRHGVILNGYDDAWTSAINAHDDLLFEETHSSLAEGSPPWIELLTCTKRKKNDLTRFCIEMKEGDVVVLRWGRSHVCGVGILEQVLNSSPQFGDVDGWNIRLLRRTRWIWRPDPKPAFFKNGLKWGDTTQPLTRSGDVWDWLQKLPEPVPDSTPLPDLGNHYSQKNLNIEEISEYLFDRGVASSAIQHLVEEIGELTRVANWYKRTGLSPSESETIAYLVVPLLKALGWTPQKMAVEWNDVDVALFDSLPRERKSLRVVVEVKKMNSACLVADEQAKRYAGPETDRIILTDGLRYGVHKRNEAGEFCLAAYLNLTRMRDSYPLLGHEGAKEAFRLMTPS